jgi:hypothetical protein
MRSFEIKSSNNFQVGKMYSIIPYDGDEWIFILDRVVNGMFYQRGASISIENGVYYEYEPGVDGTHPLIHKDEFTIIRRLVDREKINELKEVNGITL